MLEMFLSAADEEEISWDFLMAKAEEEEEMSCAETLGDVGGVD